MASRIGMSTLTVLVVGGGGREHALCLGLAKSPSVTAVHCSPGNAGTSMVASNHNVSSSDIEGIVSLALELDSNLVVVGPEAPLVNGLRLPQGCRNILLWTSFGRCSFGGL